MEQGSIIFYKGANEESDIEVRLESESIWLSQRQMADLFDRDSDSIGLHLKNFFQSGELDPLATTEDFSVVRKEGSRKVKRSIKHYNLDAIISVGYRVNSKKGTQFRIWATKILKDHLLKGYTVNQKRLDELHQSVKLIRSASESENLAIDQSQEITRVLSDFALGLQILDGYDTQSLEIPFSTTQSIFNIQYSTAKEAIEILKKEYGGSDLFGNEKDDSFKSSIAAIDQTFDGVEVYPSVE